MGDESEKVKLFDVLTGRQRFVTIFVLQCVATIGVILTMMLTVSVGLEYMYVALTIGLMSVVIIAYLTTDYLIKVFAERTKNKSHGIVY